MFETISCNVGGISKCLIVAILLFVSTFSASAEIYKYTDTSGVVRYVDDPLKIPEQFRTDDIKPHDLPKLQRENKTIKKVAARKRLQRGLTVSEIEKQLDELGGPVLEQEYQLNSDSFSPSSNISNQKLNDSAFAIGGGVILVILVMMFINIISYWMLFNKAGLPGFGIVVPIYNLVLMSRLAGKSGWWMLWLFIPLLGPLVWSTTVNFLTAKNFSRSDMFALGTVFFPFIFIPILAFSDNS